MIQISRVLARRFRAIMRRTVAAGAGRWAGPALVLTGGRDGLQIQCATANVSVAYHQPGALDEERLVVPAQFLADCEGGKDEPVVLERGPNETVQARWHDAGVPQHKEYTVPNSGAALEFPTLPTRWLPQAPELLAALHAASQTAARDKERYALNHLQLQGKSGHLVATDGRQLLIHAGFRFGWNDNVLIPALPVWGAKELPATESVSLGRSATHAFVRLGPWTLALAVDRQGRYPNVADIVPVAGARRTTWTLTAPAAALLARTLPRLPGGQDAEQPVTVDLHQPVTVRARAGEQGPVTEAVLNDSQVNGPALRFCGNRQYLARALALGFTRFELVNADKPVVACDERRTYLWMPLAAKEALPPAADAVRINGEPTTEDGVAPEAAKRARAGRLRAADPTVPGTHESSLERNGTTQPANGNRHGPGMALTTVEPGGNGVHQAVPTATQFGLLQEAEALRDLLRDGYLRSQRLLAGLKRQRQQSRLLSSTVRSLRQLNFEGQ